MNDPNKNRPGYSKTKLGWIPSDWVVQRLGLLVNIRSGNSPTIYRPSGEGRFPFIKVDDMNYSYKWQTSAREYSDVDFGVVPQFATLFAKRGAAIAINKVRIARVPLVMDSNMTARF